MTKCHDCGAEEGELHDYGCDMERCPKCGDQLISCSHQKTRPADENRIPWIEVPVLCATCGTKYPPLFKVPNKEWKSTVPKHLWDKVLCWPCFQRIKGMKRV